MSNSITELLANILAAKYGEEVRGSIHDAIELCYTDGKAGVNDLEARQLIETVAAVNEQQQAALEVLEARVEELESGEGGSSQQSTTIDIPTVLVDGGVVENVSVNNNSTTTRHITFTTEFTETPKVMVAIGKNVGAVSQYGYLSANILYPTVTTTGFDFFLANRTGSDRSPGVVWYAYQPTVKTIDLDITIPETEGMTEAEVREITGPIAAAVDALKTGYDGTTYQTAAEAVRTQINDLHVLIGDEPGTAIDASAIGYNDSNVADELTGLNERLDELEQSGTGGLTADIKAALLAAFNHVAWDSDDPTGQSYINALQTALYPPANLASISAIYTQSGTVYNTDSLDDLKSDLVVTAHYSDSTTETISNYTLSGTLTVGTSTITVAYGGKTTTFTVTVTKAQDVPSGYVQYDYLTTTDTTGDYVDTGLVARNLGYRSFSALSTNIKMKLTATPSASTNILGCRATSSGPGNTGTYQLFNQTAGTLLSYILGVSVTSDEIFPVGSVTEIKYVVHDGAMSTLAIGNGTPADVASVNVSEISSNNKALLLYGTNRNGTKVVGSTEVDVMELGEITLKNVSEETVLRFIPAYSEADEKYGFYEKVQGIFYGCNLGTLTGGNWS